MKNRPFHQRIRFAVAGLRDGWRRERSFRTHVMFAVAALVALLVLHPSPIWWALVALMVALVWSAELFNSALETMIDHLHPAKHEDIRVVKDMAAAGVLVLSVAALVVAVALLVAQIGRGNAVDTLIGFGMHLLR